MPAWNRNTARQPISSRKMLVSHGAIASIENAPPPKRSISAPRSAGVDTSCTRMREAANRPPAPRPCTALPEISPAGLANSAQISEPRMNTTSDASVKRLYVTRRATWSSTMFISTAVAA
ncbi:hypothetical protein D9M68_726630 [compost metagenome]